MLPCYTIMRLPGEERPEFIQMLPFTPRQKDNLAAWMVARSDGEHYGQLVVFQFPKQKVVFGPRQVIARINQDQVISPQITLWNQQGSEVIQGTLLVIPIEESLLYIRPLYLRSAGGKIPELKRVIVAYQNQIVMEETLEACLDRIFPPGSGATKMAGTAAASLAAAATVAAADAGRRRGRARRPRHPPPPASAAPPAGPPLPADLAQQARTCTSARSTRSGRATGRATARRSSVWATSSSGWPSDAAPAVARPRGLARSTPCAATVAPTA